MNKIAMICGASRGIGLALTKSLAANPNYSLVIATHRKSSNTESLSRLIKSFPKKVLTVELNTDSPASFESMGEMLCYRCNSIDLLINCIGFLSSETQIPEKNIDEVTTESLVNSFKVNAAPTLLLVKSLKPFLLRSKRSVFISLSARVGSIGDNKTGGWYSYRVSKAALNMCIKNLSIELNRIEKKCIVFSLHPGTTETHLTQPFLENAKKRYVIHSPKNTAENILKIALQATSEKHNGKFIAWDGSEIPW